TQRFRVRVEAGDAHSIGEVVLPSPDWIDLRASPLAPLIDRSLLEDDEAVVALFERPRNKCTAAPREEYGHAGKKRCRPLLPATFNLHPTLDADLNLCSLLPRVEGDDPSRKRGVHSLLPIAKDRLQGFCKLRAQVVHAGIASTSEYQSAPWVSPVCVTDWMMNQPSTCSLSTCRRRAGWSSPLRSDRTFRMSRVAPSGVCSFAHVGEPIKIGRAHV